jgi:hypothetical protein
MNMLSLSLKFKRRKNLNELTLIKNKTKICLPFILLIKTINKENK